MNTIRILRDIAIWLLALWILILSMWIRLSPELIGEWLAKRDAAYEAKLDQLR